MYQRPRRFNQLNLLLIILIAVGFTLFIEFKFKSVKTMVQANTHKRRAVQVKTQYVATDLRPLLEGTPPLTSETIETFFSQGRMVYETHFHFIVRVQIVGGQIFVSEDTDLHHDVRGRLNRVIESLYDALTAHDLPDADFVLQVGDGAPWELLPFKPKDEGREIFVPFFAQDKPRSVHAILIPPRGCLDPDHSAVDWCFRDSGIARASRIPRAVWRGSTTGGSYTADSWQQETRTKVVKLSRKRPDLLDASFVHIKPTSDVFKRMLAEGLNGPSMTTAEQREYAVIVVVDGNTVPDRLASQFLSGPAIVRQESFHHEYWYDDLEPWVHYIPVREDLADLEETLEKSLADKAMLANVSAAARSFVLSHLGPANIRGYWNDVLTLYSKNMRGAIRPANGSRLVNQPRCLEDNCLETNKHKSFGFVQPRAIQCNAPLEFRTSSYRHRCSRWTGALATEDLFCVLYNVSILCTDCDLAGTCIQSCNMKKHGVMGGCNGLCLQWLRSSSSRAEKMDSIHGLGNVLMVDPGSSNSCDIDLSVPAIALSGHGFQKILDRACYSLFLLYVVMEEFGFGTDVQLLFTNVNSVQELGSLAPLVLAMTDRAPMFLPKLTNQKLCVGALATGIVYEEKNAALRVSMLARERNPFLSRMGFFASNRIYAQRMVSHSILATAKAGCKHEVGFFGGPLMAKGVHLDIFLKSLEHRGLHTVFLPNHAPVKQTLQALRSLSCIVGTTDSLVYMIFAPRIVGVVEVLFPEEDIPACSRALSVQMGRKLVHVMLGREGIVPGSPLILPSFKTGQAIRQILESDPTTASESSVYRELLLQQWPCGSPQAPPCVLGSRRLVCTSLAPHFVLSIEKQPPPREGCFGGDLSWGTCDHGEFLCDHSPSRPVLSSNTVVQHLCLNGVCALRNMVFYPPWTDPWCHGLAEGKKRFCVGCSVRNASGTQSCADPVGAGTKRLLQKKASWGKLAAQGSPLASLQNGLVDDGTVGVLALNGSPGECQTYVQGLAVLTFVKGMNLYRQVMQTMIQVFEVVVQFGHLGEAMHATRSQHVEQHMRSLPLGFDCTIIVEDHAMLNSLGPFGSPILQRLCRHRPLALLSDTGPVCFHQLVLRAMPGYLDISVDQKLSRPVRYSSMIMGLCLRNLFQAPLRIALSPGGRGLQILFMQRRGMQEIINYGSAMDNLLSKARLKETTIVPFEFDGMTLDQIVRNVSASHVVAGVHGVGLICAIFMTVPAALVEVSNVVSDPEFVRLAQSLRVSHFSFTGVLLVGPKDQNSREMHVYIMDVKGLSRTVFGAAHHVLRELHETPMLVW